MAELDYQLRSAVALERLAGVRSFPNAVPAPVAGLNTLDPIAQMEPLYALTLQNMLPEKGRVIGRRGHTLHIDLSKVAPPNADAGDVGTLAAYEFRDHDYLIAFTETGVWNVSDPDAPVKIGGVAATSNQWRTAQVQGSLIAVNGEDTPIKLTVSQGTVVNGAHGFSGNALNVNDLNYIEVHHNRIFFAEKGSSKLWYGALNAITGNLSSIDLGLVVQGDREIRAIGSVTLDTGSGVDDLLAIFMDHGHVLLYSGTDPGDADNWRIVGTFDIGPVVGSRPLVRLGGDLVAITADGFLPLLPFLRVGQYEKHFAISNKIEPTINELVRDHWDEQGWQAILHTPSNWLLFNVPIGSGEHHQFVSNPQTGAWAQFTGMNALCWGVWKRGIYFGAAGGKVFKADDGVDDDGRPIPFVSQSAYNYMGSPGNKLFTLIRPHTESAGGETGIDYAIATDFSLRPPTRIPAIIAQAGSQWAKKGGADPQWGSFQWEPGLARHHRWIAVHDWGSAISLILSGSVRGKPVSLFSTDVRYQPVKDLCGSS